MEIVVSNDSLIVTSANGIGVVSTFTTYENAAERECVLGKNQTPQEIVKKEIEEKYEDAVHVEVEDYGNDWRNLSELVESILEVKFIHIAKSSATRTKIVVFLRISFGYPANFIGFFVPQCVFNVILSLNDSVVIVAIFELLMLGNIGTLEFAGISLG